MKGSQYPEEDDIVYVMRDLALHIQACNHEIANLNADKQRSETLLRDMLCHTKTGAHTHKLLDYNITVTTGVNYVLNKAAYAAYLMSNDRIDSRYNIVKPVTKYEINAKAVRDLDVFGTEKDRQLKNQFITTSEKKLHVKISRDTVPDDARLVELPF